MKQLMTGMRLESPPGLPMTFYRKMLECWDLYPDSRPTFRDLKGWFSGFSPNFAPHSIDALVFRLALHRSSQLHFRRLAGLDVAYRFGCP